jgi:hypothetical protein
MIGNMESIGSCSRTLENMNGHRGTPPNLGVVLPYRNMTSHG